MAQKLNFEPLENTEAASEGSTFPPSRRWPRRHGDEKVQMSLRMNENIYDKFRDLCRKERRTNGDMLEVMMNHYIKK